jgi:hypothetical protein
MRGHPPFPPAARFFRLAGRAGIRNPSRTLPLDLGSANARNRRAKLSFVFIAAVPLPTRTARSAGAVGCPCRAPNPKSSPNIREAAGRAAGLVFESKPSPADAAVAVAIAVAARGMIESVAFGRHHAPPIRQRRPCRRWRWEFRRSPARSALSSDAGGVDARSRGSFASRLRKNFRCRDDPIIRRPRTVAAWCTQDERNDLRRSSARLPGFDLLRLAVSVCFGGWRLSLPC